MKLTAISPTSTRTEMEFKTKSGGLRSCAGAYLGEVIRHAAPDGEFRWVDYNEYMPSHPDLQKMIPNRTAATCAFLVRRSGAMSMPLNKIARFINEGPENNVPFFASCDLKDFVGRDQKQ